MFNPVDIYTSSGTNPLYNSWTSYVSKFDTSSFYNWEQDNLPLYDLEERTYELWEQGGFATSAVQGLSLVVSADATAEGFQANSKIFADVSSCIAAIPKVVRFPVLVEVANYGDLGAIELHNFRIEEGGSIEIINRAFGRSVSPSADVEVVHTAPNVTLNKSHQMIAEVSSLDLSNALTETSAMSISATVTSSVADPRILAANSVVAVPRSKRGAVNFTIQHADFQDTVPNEFLIRPYEKYGDTGVDDTMSTLDISATNQNTGDFMTRNGAVAADFVMMNAYLNQTHRISVKNCDGPIYIRNFFVDGETTTPVGIEIHNSDVVLENCASTRCKQAGFKFNNSKITLSRSAFAYRNYNLLTTTTREAGVGVGIHGVNSEITLSALAVANETGIGDLMASGENFMFGASRNTYGIVLDNSKLLGGVNRTSVINENSGGRMYSELNTSAGITLNNSIVDVKGLIDIYGNYDGIKASNSSFRFENLSVDRHSNKGIEANNSNFVFDMSASPSTAGQATRRSVDFQFNGQDIHLKNNSSFTFERKNGVPDTYGNCSFLYSHGVTKWTDGGGNKPSLLAENGSTFELVHTKILPRQAADMQQSPTKGMAVAVVNNSNLHMFGGLSGCSYVFGPPGIANQKTVAGLFASRQSTINLHGPTVVAQFGVDALAEQNSTINIEPPKTCDGWSYDEDSFSLENTKNHTSVELHSTKACLVATKNSVINLRDLGNWTGHWANGTYGQAELTNTMDYTPTNTSGITVSGSLQFYPNPVDDSIVTTNNLDDVSSAISYTVPTLPAFSQQSNTNVHLVASDPMGGTDTDRKLISFGGMCVKVTEGSVINAHNVHFPHGNADSNLDGVYYDADADLCKRLMIWNIADTARVNASYLSVSGTHPYDSGYHGPSALYVSSNTSSTTDYLVASGAPKFTPETGSLSILDAFGAGSSVLVVPSGVSYNSPFERFYSVSTNALSGETAYDMVEAGLNASATYTTMYGAGVGTANNRGVFRLYFSVDPAANFLCNDGAGYWAGGFPNSKTYEFSATFGIVPQIYAQGYNLSANLSATLYSDGTAPSSVYPQLLKYSFDEDVDGVNDVLWTSGFYYCKEFVRDDPMQCMLDDSAANAFANAKNASLGSSGRPKKVTIYQSGGATGGGNYGSEAYSDGAHGRGFKSSNIFDLERDN